MLKKLGICIFVIALCFFLSSVSYGQCRRAVRRVVVNDVQHEVVVTEAYVEPTYVPVLVPATVFQYLPAMQPQQQMTEQSLEKTIQDRVDAIIRERYGKQADTDGPPNLVSVGSIPTKQPTEIEETPQTLNQKAADILSSYSCVKCHTSGIKIRGDVQLFKTQGDKLLFTPNVSKEAIFGAIKGPSPRMPPTAKGDPKHPDAVKAEHVVLIERWARTK